MWKKRVPQNDLFEKNCRKSGGKIPHCKYGGVEQNIRTSNLLWLVNLLPLISRFKKALLSETNGQDARNKALFLGGGTLGDGVNRLGIVFQGFPGW